MLLIKPLLTAVFMNYVAGSAAKYYHEVAVSKILVADLAVTVIQLPVPEIQVTVLVHFKLTHFALLQTSVHVLLVVEVLVAK